MEIRNVWAVGRNYLEHAKELGNEVPKTPLIFLKAGSSVTFAESEIRIPKWCVEVHHEVELALQFDHKRKIAKACIALDLTERKKQAELKSQGHPWTLSKSFIGSCPVSPFFSVGSLEELKNINLMLRVNGDTCQKGNTSQMIFSIETLIQYVLDYFPVCEGDLLLTGTPSGVGPLKKNDQIAVELEGKVMHEWLVK